MDPAGRLPPFNGHALSNDAPLSAVDCRATLPKRVKRNPRPDVLSHARPHAWCALVEAVVRRLPIAVIGALTHGPCRANASVQWSCPIERRTAIGGRLSCDPTKAGQPPPSPGCAFACTATRVVCVGRGGRQTPADSGDRRFDAWPLPGGRLRSMVMPFRSVHRYRRSTVVRPYPCGSAERRIAGELHSYGRTVARRSRR